MKSRIVALAGMALVGGSLALAAHADAPPAATRVVADAAPRITAADLLARLDRKDTDVVVLDVRTAAEYAAGHVPGARNISHDELAGRVDELAGLRDKEVVLYCRSGRRTALAEDVLRNAGFTRLRHLDGDFLAWQAQNRPVETDAK
jgi:phage shock protein E